MARAPLLQLSDITLGFGGQPLFEGVDLVVHPGDRLALVGRNGSGKSTLMKVMAGLVEPDGGTRVVAPGIRVGYMEQHPDMSGFRTLGDFAAAMLGPAEAYRVEMAAEGLKFRPETPVATASGGERRRAALARLLAEAPELMLLDEPTNHLDIEAVLWLERQLAETRAAFVLISHDRAFMRALSRATLWLDRGILRRQDKGFDHFEAWRDATWAAEDEARHKLERKIREEARWAVEGISARRRRNQGRLRALADLRRQRAEMIGRQGTASMELSDARGSGRLVIEARGLSKAWEGRQIVRDFSLRILRGDRVALVGPNGVGKTTLLRMLIGELAPDAGSVRLGTNLEIAVFDQNRSALDPDATLWETLTLDPGIGVRGRSDQVMVRGQPRHVVGYLKDFLFSESQARAPVRSLSGGEKARLLLARLMAREANLLVLDEPTNDLDVETLDLLQELVADFAGTVLLVSHDRDFLDRVATTTIAMEGDGRAQVHAGGWTDYMRQKTRAEAEAARPGGRPGGKSGGKGGAATRTGARPRRDGARAEAKGGDRAPKGGNGSGKAARDGLTFTEAHRLEALPAEIERLEAEIRKLEEFLSAPDLFTREPVKFHKATEALAERQLRLAEAEDEWLRLEEKASAGG